MIDALLQPRAYPHPVGEVRLEETHISWVLLAGRYAYKLKKPVNLGFIDLSTPERRRFDCDEEVRLNRRLCPDVYLGVVDVVEREGSYWIGSDDGGDPVEPAVQMRRLPAEGMLPRLIAERIADARLMRRLARHLARFHATAATGSGVDEYGTLATVRANWHENFDQISPYVERTISRPINTAIEAYVQRFLAEHAALLERRVTQGRVRDGHGDLHAASICVEGRRLQLFDCIEFTPRFRCADVAAEVAFLAMDLAHRARADLSAAFVDAYVRASGDRDLMQLLDFYRCYRAFVRGKVLSLRLSQPALPPDDVVRLETDARAYFDLAWAYAGGVEQPLAVMVMGLPASGKTSLAERLAGRLGMLHLSSDLLRKELAGTRPTTRSADRFREGLYSPSMTRRTYVTQRQRAAAWLRSGGSVVLDATFGNPDERAGVRQMAKRANARLLVIECQADDATLQSRLAARAEQPSSTSDARLELWPALKSEYHSPTELGDVHRVDTQRALDESVHQVLEIIRRE